MGASDTLCEALFFHLIKRRPKFGITEVCLPTTSGLLVKTSKGKPNKLTKREKLSKNVPHLLSYQPFLKRFI